MKHIFLAFFFLASAPVFAETPAKTPPPSDKPSPSPAPEGPEEADVTKIKEKYWARGEESSMSVVQNRLFSKEKKFELGLTVGTLSADPFLTTTTLNLSGGYHFTEFFSLHAIYGHAFVGPSSALRTLETQLKTTANTNEPKYFLDMEARASLLYGKLSLLGAKILYFDLHFSGGLGMVSTESGKNFNFTFGIGQQIFLSQTFVLNFSYKLGWYRETILGKVGGANGNLGQNLGKRANFSSVLGVGITMLLDPFSPSKK